MATILRSSKYVRNFAEFATKLGFSHIKPDPRVSLLSQKNLVPSTLAKSLATQVAAKQLENDSNLEITLRRLDNDVRRYGRISRSKLERILNAFQSSKSVTSTQALMVIRCCGNLVPDELPESRSELVNQVWKSLENSGIDLELSHYNALLRVYVENEYAFSPTEVLAELERKGIEPNKLTYQRLINRYCQQGDIEGASKILEFMREKQISVNENIFTALVRGHSEANDMVSAADILSVMRQAGLEPSADTYKELLCGYAKRGDVESITSTLSECEAKDVHLLDTDFLDVIFSLASNGHAAHVGMILSVMPKEVGYLQDALSHVLKLVHAGQLDVAMQVLSSIPNRDKGLTGASIIKQLAKADLPLPTILDLCKQIESKGIHTRALLIGLEVQLSQGNVEGSLAFLQAIEESNLEVREHYFWPIFVALGRAKDNAGINDLLQSMKNEYRINISGETLRDYVVPNKTGQPDEILADLLPLGLSTGSIAHAIVHNLVNQMKIKEAAEFAPQHSFRYNSVMFCRPLVAALAQTKDVESFVAILRHIYQNRFNTTMIKNQSIPVDNRILEPYIIDVAAYIKDDKSEILSEVLEQLLAAGYGISESCIANIKRLVSNRTTPELTRLLNKFKSRASGSALLPAADVASCRAEISRLEESIDRFSTNEEIAMGVKKRLLFLYSRVKDLPNLEKLAAELKEQNVQFTDTMYRQLFDAYLYSDVLDKSEEYLTQLIQSDPQYTLDDNKLIKYISLLAKEDRVDDAVQFLEGQLSIKSRDSGRFRNISWRILNNLAEMGEATAVKEVFEMLCKNDYIDISSPNLGPLVKVHIVRDDLKEALSTFERICETYQHTPLKNELTKKLIQAEDATALQRLTDLSTQVHGESNSLYDLAQSFIESDCLRQAKKILEIPALHSRFHRLKVGSNRYSEQGMTIYLERLISVIKDVPFFKTIPDFYDDLLICYDKENNWEKGLKLKQQMEDDEVDASSVFLATLAKLLQRNNQPVPFTVPQGIKVPKDNESQVSRPAKSSPTRKKKAEKKNDNSDADQSKQNMTPAKEESQLIESLLQSNKLHAAFEIAQNLLERKAYPQHRTFRFLIRKAGIAGEIEMLDNLGKNMPVPMKKAVDYDNNICQAHIAAGKAEEYLDRLERDLELTDTSDPNKVLAEFPMAGIRNLLHEQPQFMERFTQLAEKQAARGNMLPINTLWIHHFINGHPEADRIWSEHLVKTPNVLFHSIVRAAQKQNSAELLKKLLKTFETGSHVDNKSKGFAYSELIKLSYLNGHYQESVDILREALKIVSKDDLQHSTLAQMKAYLGSKGLVLPADIFSETKASEAKEQLTT